MGKIPLLSVGEAAEMSGCQGCTLMRQDDGKYTLRSASGDVDVAQVSEACSAGELE